MKYLILLSLFFLACESNGVNPIIETTTGNAVYCGRAYSTDDTITFARIVLTNGTGHISFWCLPDEYNHEDTLERWRDSILSYRIKGDSLFGIVGDQGGNVPTPFTYVSRVEQYRTYGTVYRLDSNSYFNPNELNLRVIHSRNCN